MQNRSTDDVDINYGVDFERAKERLDFIAGRLYQIYRAAKGAGDIRAAGEARVAWQEARTRAGVLRLDDEEGIRAVLSVL